MHCADLLPACSPFRVTEDDHELAALRKTFEKSSKKKAAAAAAAAAQTQPATSPEQDSSRQLAREWSGVSAIPSFHQLDASLRSALASPCGVAASLLCCATAALCLKLPHAVLTRCSTHVPVLPGQHEGLSQARALCRPAPANALGQQPAWQAKREDMRALLAQKRNIFLVMMAMDTKRDEIAKLKQHTLQRGTALAKGEQMLSEDTAKFDAFLKENDEKLRQAMHEADNEVRAKQEKVRSQKGGDVLYESAILSTPNAAGPCSILPQCSAAQTALAHRHLESNRHLHLS